MIRKMEKIALLKSLYYDKKWNLLPIIGGTNDYDRNKKPMLKWDKYKTEKYPYEDLEKHVKNGGNVAVITGKVSNNLTALDLDAKYKTDDIDDLLSRFFKKYPEAKTLMSKTPGGGRHLFYQIKGETLPTNESHRNELFDKDDNFKGITKTEYSTILKSVDVRGEGGYILIEPSENVGNSKYEFVNLENVKEISKEEFDIYKAFFLLEKITSARKGFVDIINGKIDLMEQITHANEEMKKGGDTKDLSEHVYWRYLFFEIYHMCGMAAEEIFKKLKNTQPEFDEKKTRSQLKHSYNEPWGEKYNRETNKKEKNKPFSNKTYNVYFPQYKIKTTESRETLYKVFEKEIKKPAIYTRDNKKYETNAFKKWIKNKNIQKAIEIEEKQSKEEKEEIFYYNGNLIVKRKNQIVFRKEYETDEGKKYYGPPEEILDAPFELKLKTILDEKYLYNFSFNNVPVKITKTVEQLANDYTGYICGRYGKDCFKAYIRKKGKIIEFRAPWKILGYDYRDDKWKIPETENEKDKNGDKHLIIIDTDYQKDAYNRLKENFNHYTDKEKEKIKNMVKRFIEITKMNKKKLACIIGWCVAAPFRGIFIDKFDFFPFLLLTGPTQTAKNTVLKAFAVDFYQVYNGFLSLSTISKNSRFEDYLSTSTFPLIINEAVGIEKIEGAGELKTMCTEDTDYTRKLSARYSIKRPKVAPFGFTANYVDPFFLDEAVMGRTLHIEFTKKETIEKEIKWLNLRNSLKQYNLFSLMYDWYIEKTGTQQYLISYLIQEATKKFFQYKEHKKYSKFMEIVSMIWTGLFIFNAVFTPENETELLDISIEEIMEVLSEGKKAPFKGLVEEIKQYIDTVERCYANDPDADKKWKTPIFRNAHGDIIFTTPNITDFMKSNNLYKNIRIKLLYLNIKAGLKNEELIEEINKYPINFPFTTTKYGFKLKDNFFKFKKEEKSSTLFDIFVNNKQKKEKNNINMKSIEPEVLINQKKTKQ